MITVCSKRRYIYGLHTADPTKGEDNNFLCRANPTVTFSDMSNMNEVTYIHVLLSYSAILLKTTTDRRD